jgi:hypothetical protein
MNAARRLSRIFPVMLSLSVLALWAAWAASAESDTPAAVGEPAQPAQPPIKVNDLNERPVVGSLGQPLGKMVTVEGVVAEGDFTRKKSDVGATLLRIQKVDGRPLKHEVIFHFSPSSMVTIEKPAVGSRFKYVGYETGAFTGTPPGEFKYTGPFATTTYHFATSFEVLKDEKSKP